MSYFEWSDKLDIGVLEMNTEHKTLLGLMDKLHACSTSGSTHTEINAVLDELTAFTLKHFDHEEKYMAQIEYPGLKQHKEIHASLLKRFGFHRDEYNKIKGPLPENFFRFLKQWLSAHIQGIDCEYGKHALKSERTAS